MSTRLSADDIEALAVGAWILGTGGGGSPYYALLNMRRQVAEGVSIDLIDPEELADDDLVAVVSTQGAPLVVQERLNDSRLAARSVELMEQHLGRRFRAVMGIEVGGANALQPLMAAAHLGIPVVDADAMGRAYPEAQMTSFAVGGLKPDPLTSVDPRGNEVIVAAAPTFEWMERTSRRICTEFGSVAATCKAPRTGREVKDWGVLGSMSRAIRLGAAVHAAQQRHDDPVATILAAEKGAFLCAGKVVEVKRETTGGFLRGAVAILAEAGERFDLAFQNEWVVAWRESVPVAMTPELICVLASDSGEAVGTETIRYGQRVTVIILPAPAVFCSEEGLRRVGPAAFGYDIPFQSVFAP